MKKITNNYLKIVYFLVPLFIFLMFTFVRTFMGIYIFNLRVGEIVVGFSLVVSFVLLIYFLIMRKHSFVQNKLSFNFGLIIASFFRSFNNFRWWNFDLYTYKSSSYVWTTSIFFLNFVLQIHKY